MVNAPGEPRSLRTLLDGRATLSAVTAYLDGLTPAARLHEARELPPLGLDILWEISAAAPPLTVSHVLPPSRAAHHALRWVGRSTRPPFRQLELPCFQDEHGRVWGRVVPAYDLMATVVGPMYFAVTAHPEWPGEVCLSFDRVPDTAPPGWPEIRQHGRTSALMLQGVPDRLRGAAAGVLVGRAEATGAHSILVVVED
ncbi:MAG: hypothetical protein HY904_25785 [Deltaproteobacteria bacterium]|nr:hypothetical protein [Deltaproteobacteria bacterium]